MVAFAAHCEAQGAREISQVGGGHVVNYWRSLRFSGGLADSTLYSHWLAIRELWKLAGKPGEPPRPFNAEQQPAGGSRPVQGGGAAGPTGVGGRSPTFGSATRGA